MKKISPPFFIVALLIIIFSPGCRGKEREPKLNPEQPQTVMKKSKTEKTRPSSLNHPPRVVFAEILPNPAYANTDLRVEAQAEDQDGDIVELRYQWIFFKEKREGVRVAEEIPGATTSTLSHEKFVHGDIVAVKITPVDWKGSQGETYQTRFCLIKNSPPEIVSSPPETISGPIFTYQVIARDRDNDPISFSLSEDVPEGMTINSATGLITWPIPSDSSGAYTIRVNGDDGQGGTCYQRFTLTLTGKTNLEEK